jgi:hypothetical protein
LLASDPSAVDALAGALTVLGPADEGTAHHLAIRATEQFGAPLGLGLVTRVAGDDRAIFEGTVEVALAGAREVEESFQTRASFEDVQRRAALSAADVLRRALAPSG